MCYPAVFSGVNVQVAKGTSIGSCQRLSRYTLLLLHMGFVVSLVNCLLTSWTFLIVFTVFALRNKVSCIGIYFNCLLTLVTNKKHWAGIIEMKITVILILKLFVISLAKLTNVLYVGDFLFGHLNKLVFVLNFFVVHLLLCISRVLHCLFLWFNRSFIEVSVIFPPFFVEFLFNCFDYFGS